LGRNSFKKNRAWVRVVRGYCHFKELRENLRSHDFNFATESDTEVLKTYQQWATSCFAQFDDMFAGAIPRIATDKLGLFRDHLGQKPLYYLHDNDNLIVFNHFPSIIWV